MPLFHFDVRYSDEPWSDDETGTELAAAGMARAEALDLLASLAKEQLRQNNAIAVRIRHGDPEPILILSLSLRAEERA